VDQTSHGIAVHHDRVESYDALTDTPVPAIYPQLDERFPGAKFVLTYRDVDTWLASCERNHIWPGLFVGNTWVARQKHLGTILRLHQELYGSITFDKDTFARHYRRHNQAVMEYFAGRPESLLVIDICGGEGWGTLCPFLDKPVPAQPFPRRNVGAKKRLKRLTRRWFWMAVGAMAMVAHRQTASSAPAECPLE
jgi:hypothetical protein